jgi:hypothetical protein
MSGCATCGAGCALLSVLSYATDDVLHEQCMNSDCAA